jgi:hypothetical protein
LPLTTQMARYIEDIELGCRAGDTAERAAYGLEDIFKGPIEKVDPATRAKTLIKWTMNPDDPQFTPLWDNRLWNTCHLIAELKSQGSGTVLLVSRAAPNAERYQYTGNDSRGDGYTFAKKNSLPSNSEVLATVDSYTDGTDLYNKILDHITTLAGG